MTAQQQHAHHPTAHTSDTDERTWWENRYSESDRIWSGRPNELLVREVADLPPGRALEIGCGEGADAIWLAGRGWHVTGVDIAATALERAAEHAAAAGVADRVDLQRHDVVVTLPEGHFDLVCAQYYHSPVAQAGVREDVLRRAAGLVAPGGRLLVVGHFGWPEWLAPEDRPDVHFPSTAEVLDVVGGSRSWDVVTDDVVEREALSPEGVPGTRTDNVLHVRRRG